MKVVAVKLRTTPESKSALDDTMQRFNEACNHLSSIAWERKEFRAFTIQGIAYHETRALFGLPAQLTVRAIAKVADSYKLDRSIQHAFGMKSAVVFDARCFKLKNLSSVELTTTRGRFAFVMQHGGKQRADLDGATTGEADLLYRDGEYYLAITVKKPEPPTADTSGGILGVDLGITEIATDSEGNQYSGEPVKALRRKYQRIRTLLQKSQTKSARRHLRKIKRRQSRFVANMNHIISKQIVQTALLSAKALALENLTGIRERASGFSRQVRWLMGNWSFADLAAKITHKAKESGIPVYQVDPRNTSRTCSGCGFCDKANRKSQAHFKCLSCGFFCNADINASVNISRKVEETRASFVNTPIVSTCLSVS